MKKIHLKHWHVIAFVLNIYDALAVTLSYLAALWLRFDLQFSRIDPFFLMPGNHLRLYMQFSACFCSGNCVCTGLYGVMPVLMSWCVFLQHPQSVLFSIQPVSQSFSRGCPFPIT